jgi:hypothetical protein
MKTIISHISRAILLLTVYVCCSSVVCCEVTKAAAVRSSTESESKCAGYSKQSFDEDLTPLRMISVHLMDLL